MRIKKIDLELVSNTDKEHAQLTFIRPKGAKLFRVVSIPESEADNRELIQVLNTLCKLFRNGVFYFAFDQEAQADMMMILYHMQIPFIFIEPQPKWINPELN